jgi:hypothetical protein
MIATLAAALVDADALHRDPCLLSPSRCRDLQERRDPAMAQPWVRRGFL